jgi:hypothetical protein
MHEEHTEAEGVRMRRDVVRRILSLQPHSFRTSLVARRSSSSIRSDRIIGRHRDPQIAMHGRPKRRCSRMETCRWNCSLPLRRRNRLPSRVCFPVCSYG